MDGVRYEGSENFQNGVDQQVALALGQVTALPKPITFKRLIILIPSEEAIYNENVKRRNALRGDSPLATLEKEMIENLSKSNYKLSVVLHNGLRKRGIYSEVIIKESPSMVNSIEPAQDYDVLYYTEASAGSGQMFYSSVKHGRQVFAWDRSAPNITGKLNSFIQSVQILAIRD